MAKMRDTPLDANEIAKLRMPIARDIGPKVPWYTCPKPPRTFKFVPGAAPVYPAHVRVNTITKPKHELTRCYGGPFNLELLDVCKEKIGATLSFMHEGLCGRYVYVNGMLKWMVE